MPESVQWQLHIRKLTPEYESKIRQIPFLNIDSLLIPSPYIKDKSLDIDYDHSYVWDEDGEILGYVLIYSNPEKSKFHIYKQVSSPFGRGKGVGSGFLNQLVNDVQRDATVYLYVWEKLISSLDFFTSKGFRFEESIVYRKMKFHLISAPAHAIRERINLSKEKDYSVAEELGKVRHDAKKTIKVLFDLTSMLSVDNFNKVIEDINRETTALMNTLNMYEGKIKAHHEVHLKELITERVIPYVEASNIPCEIRFSLGHRIPPVIGNYTSISRALINLVSNSLDAIRETGRRGIIEITLTAFADMVNLTIRDNGVGISEERLQIGADMLPLFVGKTTKQGKTGEGVGTRQIFSTFGYDNITVDSKEQEYTCWSITMKKKLPQDRSLLTELESTYEALMKATEQVGITIQSSAAQVESYIWQLRQLEIFCYDLVYQFSRYNNVRDIYRNILLYWYGGKDSDFISAALNKCRVDDETVKSWLLGVVKRIKRNETYIRQHFAMLEYRGIMFRSYGQAVGRTMVFTLNPDTGAVLVTDRKLAEHLDLVPYLDSDRDSLLRGEFIGDVRNITSPVTMGVWTVHDLDDLFQKLRLIQQGARLLLEMGLPPDKRLSFYSTTYNTSECELDVIKTTTLSDMATMADVDLEKFIVATDNELQGMVFAD